MENERKSDSDFLLECNPQGGLIIDIPGSTARPVLDARGPIGANSSGFLPAFLAEGLLGRMDQSTGDTVISQLDACIDRLNAHLHKHPMDYLTEEAVCNLRKAREHLLKAEHKHHPAQVTHPVSVRN